MIFSSCIFFRIKRKRARFYSSLLNNNKLLFYNNIYAQKAVLNSFLFSIVFFMFVAFSNLKLCKNWQ
jgi:polyferredoxin